MILQGDCLEVLKGMEANSVDAVITDPPYGLSNHSPADVTACLTAWLVGDEFKPAKKGFMGKSWDAWVPGPEVWRECLRVLKPGGHVLAFAGTRSMDLMSLAIRLAGFELRDAIGYAHDNGGAPLLAWCHGQGFPKSLDVSKAIDKEAGAEREVTGVAGKSGSKRNAMAGDFKGGEYMETAPATEAARQWQGWGTALKPAWEPVILARKPLEGTVAANVQKHGTGGINVDGCRIETNEKLARPFNEAKNEILGKYARFGNPVEPSGRFPANVIFSEEVAAALDEQSGVLTSGPNPKRRKASMGYPGSEGQDTCEAPRGKDVGGASRFYYCPKASPSERAGSSHPTMKPLALMRYLCRLVTPPNGLVLDPFAGSGTTGVAALQEGFRFIGIEREPEYIEIATRRLEKISNGQHI